MHFEIHNPEDLKAFVKQLMQSECVDVNDMLDVITDAADELKAEQETKMEKERLVKERGEKLAAIATRALDNQLTADDVAFIFQIFLNQSCDKPELVAELCSADLVNGIVEIVKSMLPLYEALYKEDASPSTPSEDEVIRQFLDHIL